MQSEYLTLDTLPFIYSQFLYSAAMMYLQIFPIDGRCKLTLTDGRNRLKTDSVEVVECVRR